MIMKYDDNITGAVKFGQIMGKAVDYILSRLTFGVDPMDFEPCEMDVQEKEKKAEELVELGRDFLKKGKISTAIPFLIAAHKLVPNDHEIRLTCVYGLCNSPQHFRLLASMDSSFPESFRNDPRLAEVKAATHYLEKDKEGARRYLQSQIQNFTRFRSFAGNLMAGILLFDLNREKAAVYFQWAISIVPDNLEAHICLQRCHESLGQLKEAETEKCIAAFLK
ncbi:MAG: hypothetical protein CVV64_16090 [Candidatus Wallbacteria bacterium HGW-Wallbacteria-1]|jgi:tetratricopeptide (TPR) repeat protein|uniref:Uncharacterized protein n=1 Tax=Candidatus Wallbacteria bacterium HGW-Wallbacteria-1 TaxID=2013854 RepID=A0A2N1PL59_9BACT|nr:MAG: hypothetical protein CVV64_16090 [Candidatus Wallbacteria bacterium HGW-Wallbacteria-1]